MRRLKKNNQEAEKAFREADDKCGLAHDVEKTLARVTPEEPATTAHWCPKGRHAYRCSHLATETCARGNHSEVNCPEHGGPKVHSTRTSSRATIPSKS